MNNMKKFAKKKPSCPVEDTISIIGAKWTVLIVRDLLTGTKRFGELQRSLDGISPRTLSARLQDLDEHRLLTKKVYPTVPPHTEYTLTKKGVALASIVEDMAVWGKKYPAK